MKASKRKLHWFKKVRGSYLPDSWQGWALYVPYACYIIGVISFVWLRSYDLGVALFIVVPNVIAALIIMTWIAERTS